MEEWFAYGPLGEDHRLVNPTDDAFKGKCVHGAPLDESMGCGMCTQGWKFLVEAKVWTEQTVMPARPAEVAMLSVPEGEGGAVKTIVMPEGLLPRDVSDASQGIPGDVSEEDIAARTVNEEVFIPEPKPPAPPPAPAPVHGTATAPGQIKKTKP